MIAAGKIGAGGQPSTQQLRMLVQQIQLAVQAGYLNHQILNQPLAPTTLVLLNQLLTNIKVSASSVQCFQFRLIGAYLLTKDTNPIEL